MPEDREQRDVLRKKDNVTQGSRGLQQWGDEGQPDVQSSGTGSSGTAERQARVVLGQMGQDEAPEKARNGEGRAKGQLGADEDEA